MKKIISLALCLICAAATASAQFKIHSNGYLSFMRSDTSLPVSPISLADGSNSKYFVSYQSERNGILSKVVDEAQAISGKNYSGDFWCNGIYSETNIGVRGLSSSNISSSLNNNPGCIGLWGECFTSETDEKYGYGVFGKASGTENSVGVCGMARGSSASDAIPNDSYAGLFVGKTKVVGPLIVTGTINGITLGQQALSSHSSELVSEKGVQVTNMMMGLNARSFRQEPTAKQSEAVPTFLERSEEEKEELAKMGINVFNLNESVEEDVFARQIQEKQHYGLSADELEKIFPDLVYEDKDGSKKVNYVEMVPLLVQCINELNARLSAMDGGNAKSEARATRAGLTAIDSTPAKTKAVLYQNTPNPFNAQTEIRFSLPDDAPQAYIYIFDMTGKMQKQIPVTPSQQSITINGYELQAGIYLYSLVVGGQEIDTKRMILSK